MYRVVVGLGSNMGSREGMLRAGVAALCARSGATLVSRAKIYRTPPLGPVQPDYLNTAVLLETSLKPNDLLTHALAIEIMLGRERRVRWGPRTVDIDILWVEGLVVRNARIDVPHPELTARSFALGPLLDVVPDAIDPRNQRPLSDAMTLLPAISDVPPWEFLAHGRSEFALDAADALAIEADALLQPATPAGPVQLYVREFSESTREQWLQSVRQVALELQPVAVVVHEVSNTTVRGAMLGTIRQRNTMPAGS